MAEERTALEILNALEDELGLNRSSSVTATIASTRQRLAMINNTLEECQVFGAWSALEKEAIIEFGAPTTAAGTLVADDATVTLADTSFLTAGGAIASAWMVTGEGIQNNTRVASVTNATTLELDKTADTSGTPDLTFTRDTFAIPTDFHRWIPQTHWDSRLMWQMIGPTSSQFDAWQRNGIVGPFPRRQYRRQGPRPVALRIFPPPSATGAYPGTLSYRYITNEPVQAADGSTKRFFTANTDLSIVPDRLLILGGKWRWQQAKGFDFGPLQEEFYNWFDSALVDDTGPTIVPLNGTAPCYPENPVYNVQDGNFPSA